MSDLQTNLEASSSDRPSAAVSLSARWSVSLSVPACEFVEVELGVTHVATVKERGENKIEDSHHEMKIAHDAK